MAQEGKTLGQLVADLQAEYGEHQYGRIDLHISDDIKNAAIARARALPIGDATFAGMPILRQENLDGVKFYLDNPEAKTNPTPPKPGCCSAPAAPSRSCASTPNPAPKNPSPNSWNPRAVSHWASETAPKILNCHLDIDLSS